MLKLRTFVLPFRSERRKASNAVGVGWLKMSCVVSAFCLAAGMPAMGQGFTVIHDFAGYLTESGAQPFSGLIQGTDGNFYGTTSEGGGGSCTFGCGTIYRITADDTFSVLYSFQEPDWGPSSGLIQATDGNFYGTTAWGGGSSNCYFTNGCGTIYRITPQGAFTTVYSFNEAAGPMSGVIQGRDRRLYGSTYYGGTSSNCNMGCGTIFQLAPGGTFTTVYSFSGSDGSQPGVIIQATDGNFYGITLGGGSGFGTIFKLTPNGKLTTLHSFGGADGWLPSDLIQANDGNFYGVTVAGGANSGGTVFEVTPTGTLTTLYNFCAQKGCRDGNEPSTLMQGRDGNLYGTTMWGGYIKVQGAGTIFEMGGGVLTTIYKFSPKGGSYLNGEGPEGVLMQAADGNFYGTAVNGGTNNDCGNGCGTVFTFGPATATLSKTSLNFGSQALDEASPPLSLTMKNSGVTVLNVSSVVVNGEFAIATNTCTGAALTAGQECRVALTFTPTALGLQTGTLTFTDNAGSSPQMVSLSGTGIAQATLTPASHTFPKTNVGETSAAYNFTLRNNLSTTLTGISYSTAAPFAVSTSSCGTTLDSRKTCTIGVTFSPTQLGTANGTLQVNDSANNSPQTASLSGTGD